MKFSSGLEHNTSVNHPTFGFDSGDSIWISISFMLRSSSVSVVYPKESSSSCPSETTDCSEVEALTISGEEAKKTTVLVSAYARYLN